MLDLRVYHSDRDSTYYMRSFDAAAAHVLLDVITDACSEEEGRELFAQGTYFNQFS